jgi:PhzF family phenazine biosynthesis protein
MPVDSIEIYQIDAFTDKVFHGNPAAICLLSDWLNDELLQAIAIENNLSETAFVMENKNGYQIRWFTPNGEVNLGGHATLAAGFLLFELGKNRYDQVSFSSLSGLLQVRKRSGRFMLELPRLTYRALSHTDSVAELIDKPFLELYSSDLDYLIVLANEAQVLQAQVDLAALIKLNKRGLILSSKSNEADFYSRCFYPKYNIAEDPVTGSAYSILGAFWAERLNKNSLHGIQGSFRQGDVYCEILEDKVQIAGHCRWYSKGQLLI